MNTINPMTLQVMYHHTCNYIKSEINIYYIMKSMRIVLLQVTFQFTTCANVGSIIHVVLKTSDTMPIIIQLSNKNI